MNDIASADTAAIVDGNVRINTSVFAENNAFADNAVGSDKAVRPDLRTFANYNAGFNGCGRINNGTVFDYGSGINPRLRLLLREDDLQGICKPSVRIAGNDDDTFGLFFSPNRLFVFSVKTKAVALQAPAASRYLLLAKKATSPCPAVSSEAMDLISALPPLALIVLNKVSLLFSLIRSTNSRRVIGAVC